MSATIHRLVVKNNLLAITKPHNAFEIVELEEGKHGYIANSCFFGPFDSHVEAANALQAELRLCRV